MGVDPSFALSLTHSLTRPLTHSLTHLEHLGNSLISGDEGAGSRHVQRTSHLRVATYTLTTTHTHARTHARTHAHTHTHRVDIGR